MKFNEGDLIAYARRDNNKAWVIFVYNKAGWDKKDYEYYSKNEMYFRPVWSDDKLRPKDGNIKDFILGETNGDGTRRYYRLVSKKGSTNVFGSIVREASTKEKGLALLNQL